MKSISFNRRKIFIWNSEKVISVFMFTTNINMTENLSRNPNFTRLCRCCASEHDFMYDVFCGTCSNAQTYYEVVMECAPVQLFRDDGLPSLVCHKCVLILESFVTFRSKCVESESILKQMSSSISPYEQEAFDSDRIKQDTAIVDNIKEELNDIDDTTGLGDLENSVSQKYPELKLYDEIKNESTAVNENRPYINSQVDRTDSEIDQRSFENFVDVKEEHVDNDGRKSDKPNVDTDRTEERPYPCDKCDKSFKRKSNLTEHLKIHTGKRPYTCGECGKSFITKWKLNQHRSVHADERPHACDRCDKSFRRIWDLDRHRKIHTGQKPFSCGECRKSFNRKSCLDAHRKIHAGVRPYACDRCNKSFIRLWELDRHRKVHVGR